ncbi:MAG: class I SAM-dependent methyltransferase [Lachnospiraceae bacterium]|nr:class I SAM-dependent methyltransferase [Lachnospiraceae bacterium]
MDISKEKPTLTATPEGLTLVSGDLSLRGDFASMKDRLKPNNLNGEMLVRAARVKSPLNGTAPVAVDATAGMGEDSFLLAAAGFKVYLFEKNPTIAALLKDALERACNDPAISAIASRMTFVEGDSIEGMRNLPERPDVIYLDPMFPERKKSGLIKKKFQLLQLLERPCDDENGLLQAAISASPAKIVIKRPAKAPVLGGVKPSYTISGNSIRYDCIVK